MKKFIKIWNEEDTSCPFSDGTLNGNASLVGGASKPLALKRGQSVN